jgi:hypothetical protein
MRKLAALLVVAGLAGGATFAVVAPAGASVGTKTSKFCKAVKNFDSTGLGNPTSEEDSEAYVKQLKKLGKAAKGKTKKAIGDLVDAYEELADGEDYQDVIDGNFAAAAATLGLAIVKCGIASIPDITLPDDLDLPDITLPDIDLPN